MWLNPLSLFSRVAQRRPASAPRRARVRLAVEALEARDVPSNLPVTIDNRLYVTSLYEDLLHREPDPIGLDAFGHALDSGASRDSVALSIINSLEFTRAFIAEQYEHFLGRRATTAEIDPWVRFVNAGGNFDQLQANIISSDEAFAKAASSNQVWLESLYESALGRPIDPLGLTTGLNLLSRGVSRFTIALGIMSSIEADRLTAEGFYHDFLDRRSDPQGLPGWWMALNDGVKQQKVMATFLATPEYVFLATINESTPDG